MKRFVIAIVVAALAASRSAFARDEEPPHVVVHVGPSVGRAEADRLVSAVRGQLRGAARVSTDDDGGAACAVSIDRHEADQLVLRFSDPSSGQALGERIVTHGGELGASEVLLEPPESACSARGAGRRILSYPCGGPLRRREVATRRQVRRAGE